MSKFIVGHTWEEIQAMQQGRYVRPTIDTSKPGKAPATDADRKLLAEHGTVEALEAAGLHGVADRLKP
jgi:hypothetical protein